MSVHDTVAAVTRRVIDRSGALRSDYLGRLAAERRKGPSRASVSCTNLAHVFAAQPSREKIVLREMRKPALAIVSAYNEMLSAHQPLGGYPQWLKEAALQAGAVAQFAGGVPAMCDGVTQGQPGMELSLFSRDVIAMSTAIALSHGVFDGMLLLGVCDKIVPGLLIGALQFGHLPAVFVPAGPMTTGLSNEEKARTRQRYAAGTLSREELLEAETRAYHGPGTCTFYGTANSNQFLMEVMGLHLPASAFVPPGTPLREALVRAAATRLAGLCASGPEPTAVGEMIDERSIVNAVVGLLATGGSTNHTIHLVAIARAAGIVIDWDDFDALSRVVPLVARVYPNGSGDVNALQAAGGTGFIIRELLSHGLLHPDVRTVMGTGLDHYTREPVLEDGALRWVPVREHSADPSVLRTAAQPFQADGGLRLLRGKLGRAVIKVSAVAPEHRRVRAPAVVFDDQNALLERLQSGGLRQDFIAVVRWQGPRANGMPELHKLTPALANLQEQGHRVALVTDGRMSGASGKVPAAIHVVPECLAGGPLARVRDGDMLVLDADLGVLDVEVDEATLAAREVPRPDLGANSHGMGRELFANARATAGSAEQGAMTFGFPEPGATT